jgi:hypothetical protein
MTRKELAGVVFLSERATEYNMMRMLQRGQVYVAGWSRTSGRIARVYAWGIGTDAPRPAAYSGYERVKKARANESQEDKDFRRARERAARRKIKVHPLMAAFYSIPK